MGHSCRHTLPVLTVVVLAATVLSAAFVPMGYAVAGYTAATVSADNALEARYGVLSVGFENTKYPLEDVMKGAFSTKADQDSEINKRVFSSIPDSVTFTITFRNALFTDNSYSMTITAKLNTTVSGIPDSNGNLTLSTSMSRSDIQSIIDDDGNCKLKCTITVRNNSNGTKTLSGDAAANISVSYGRFNDTVVKIPSGSISGSRSISKDTSLVWFGGTCPSIFYDHVGSDSGTVSLSFSISGIDTMDGASFRVKLGSTIYGPVTVSNGTATVTANGLALTNNAYSDTLVLLMSLDLTKRVTSYHLSITATFHSYNALTYGEMSGTEPEPEPIDIHTVDDAIEALVGDNEDLVDEGYTFEDSGSGSHGSGQSYSGGFGVTIASGGDKTISDHGAIHASMTCVPNPFVLVLSLNNTDHDGNTGPVTITLDGKSCTINVTLSDRGRSFIIYDGGDHLEYSTPSMSLGRNYNITNYMQGKTWLSG